MIAAAQQVRLIADAGRIGVTTGRTLERVGRLLLQVQFPDGAQYVPEDQLEVIPQGREHPLDLLRQGKLALAKDLRRTLTHVRLSGRLANVLYSMEVTNTDFYAYQFKPVIKMLNAPNNGILIADEVGLGKTIESGLIWTELKSRFDLRRLMVVCPAVLCDKWRDELRTRFGIKAEIVDSAGALERLNYATNEVDADGFAIICSHQGLRPRKFWDDEQEKSKTAQLGRFLSNQADERSLIDLLIVDEAHYMRNPESKTALLGRLLRDVSEHIVLLSATPIHLKSQDLFQLLNLLDEDTFSRSDDFDVILSANEPLIKAREQVLLSKLSSEEFWKLIEAARGHEILHSNRQLRSFAQNPPNSSQLADTVYRSELASKLDSINILGHAISRTRKRDVTEWKVVRKPVPEMIEMKPVEKEFYDKVTELVREFCAQCNFHEGFLLVTPQRQMASSMPAALRAWQQRKLEYLQQIYYEDTGVEIQEQKVGPLTMELIKRVDDFGDLKSLWESDSKFERLLQVVREKISQNPKEKIVVFSYFRPTIDYLNERLSQHGIRCIKLMGGPKTDKSAIRKEFKSDNGPNILLSTEVGSEGIDLQFSWMLINFDLPWNPMRVEQRIGRIDRIGQNSPKVIIWNLLYKDTIDARIYERLYKRLNIFERALGGLEPILGNEIEKLSYELLSQNLSSAQEEKRIEERALALEFIRDTEEKLEKEAAHLVAYGDYILNQVKAARELNRWIHGSDIYAYISDFFNLCYRGCEFNVDSKNSEICHVKLSIDAKHDFEKFLREQKIQSSTWLVKNDPTPVKCIFVNKIMSDSSPRSEVINQTHPLVRFVSHSSDENAQNNYPAVSVAVDKTKLPVNFQEDIYVFTVQRWTVKGMQDIERLYYAAMTLNSDTGLLNEEDSERLVVTAASRGENWESAKNIVDLAKAADKANNACLAYSDTQYDKFIEEIKNKNRDRADLQVEILDRHLKNQVAKMEITKQKHFNQNQPSYVKGMETKITNLKIRVERRKLEIEEKREIQYNKPEICVGLIKVT